VFLLPFLIVVAIAMLRIAHRTEVGGRDETGGRCTPRRSAFVVFADSRFTGCWSRRSSRTRDLYVGASDMSHIPWIFNDPPTLEH